MTRRAISKSTLRPTRGQRVDMEEPHRIGQRILDQHAFGVTCNEGFGGRVSIVGEQDGWLIVTEVGNEELAVDALKWTRFLLVEARIAVLAMGDVELDSAPGRRRQAGDFGEQCG